MFTALMCAKRLKRAIKRRGSDINTRILRDVKMRIAAKSSLANFIL